MRGVSNKHCLLTFFHFICSMVSYMNNSGKFIHKLILYGVHFTDSIINNNSTNCNTVTSESHKLQSFSIFYEQHCKFH